MSGVRIESCASDAVDLNDSDLAKITKSTLVNSGNGIEIGSDATGNVVEESVIIGRDAGVEIKGTGNVVQKNQFTANVNALRVLNGPNRVLGSGGDGIEVKDAPATLVIKNTLTGNAEVGVNLVGTSGASTVDKNTAKSNRLYGVTIEGATGVLVQNNVVTGSLCTGIAIVSPTTTVKKNTATANLGFGIRVSTTAIDGGGNKASNNGDGECDGVACAK